jgi:hypothetical protein
MMSDKCFIREACRRSKLESARALRRHVFDRGILISPDDEDRARPTADGPDCSPPLIVSESLVLIEMLNTLPIPARRKMMLRRFAKDSEVYTVCSRALDERATHAREYQSSIKTE